MKFPQIKHVSSLDSGKRNLVITAYGFEDRTLKWYEYQSNNNSKLDSALVIKYENPKGKNKIRELKKCLSKLGVSKPMELIYKGDGSADVEKQIEDTLGPIVKNYDQIILDITPLTKFLILLFLSKLESFNGSIKVLYTEAEKYSPSLDEFKSNQEKAKKSIKFPSKGFGTVLRAKCLSSIRMQGQPVTLIAFTSFNEQLVRHMLGTISPHRLLFINGAPPRKENKWREVATVSLHLKLVKEFPIGNEVTESGSLKRTVSTLLYEETFECIENIYSEYGMHERLIIAATGSKMQTVGLYFAKKKHPDIHVEYPTPDSYYNKGYSHGSKDMFELNFDRYQEFILSISE